jgi:hypothetical protein
MRVEEKLIATTSAIFGVLVILIGLIIGERLIKSKKTQPTQAYSIGHWTQNGKEYSLWCADDHAFAGRVIYDGSNWQAYTKDNIKEYVTYEDEQSAKNASEVYAEKQGYCK